MYRKKKILAILAAAALLALIFDSKTALLSAQDSVQQCIQVLIPSLFPFFVFTPLITQWDSPAFSPICRILRIPACSGGVLLSGFLGGYPSGAQAISDSVASGAISKEDGSRMLLFCSNAGPSFLFGIGIQLLGEIRYCWLLWATHILSAFFVAFIVPGDSKQSRASAVRSISLPQSVKKAVSTMALVCGWVVLFRVLIGFCRRWFLWLLPTDIQIFLSGVMELANGSLALLNIANLGKKLTFFSAFLSFGGLCVWLQTLSVTENLDNRLYLPGKLAQCSFNILISASIQFLLPMSERYYFPLWIYALNIVNLFIFWIYARKIKIKGSNPALCGV